MLTLTGPPGVGKSRLAVEVAGLLPAPGAARVVRVAMDELTEPSQVAPAVAAALAELDQGGPGGEGVIIFDDCDRVVVACAQATPHVLRQGVQVLATAREPLRAEGEVVWRVPPLSLPPPGRHGLPGVFADSDAVQLFCDRAAAAFRGFIPTPAEADSIAAICQRLDGIALAVELAARSMAAHSLSDVVARLEEPFSLLTGGVRSGHSRHRSMWASLAWTYDVLAGAERIIFDRLSVFPASFTLDAASHVCGDEAMTPADVSEILRGLLDKSLLEVDVDGGEARYRFLHIVRAFAMDQLTVSGEVDYVQDRHARWCTDLVKDAGDARSGRPWMKRLLGSHDHIHAAVDWALASGQAETGVVLGEADVRLCRVEGRYRAARQRVQQVVAAAVTAPPGLRARALTSAAIAESAGGDLVAAEAHLQQSASIAEGHGERMELARARLWSAFVAVLGSGRGALGDLEAVAAEARVGWNPHVVIEALAALGRAHLLMGEAGRAHDDFTECVGLAREHGDEVGQAWGLVGLGAAGVVLGRYREAEESLDEGLQVAKALGEVETAGEALAWLGESARRRGALGPAEASFTDAAELARGAEHAGLLAQAFLGLGAIAADRGEPAMAHGLFDEALGYARGGAPPYLAPCLCGLAEVAPDSARARDLVGEALSAAQRYGDWAAEASAFHLLADLSQADGNLRAAALRGGQALALRARVGDPAGIARSLEAVGRVAAARERFGIAARLLGAAEAVRESHGCPVSGSHRPEHVSVTESVRQALTEDAFDAEWREGRALSWPAAVRYALGQKDLRVSARSTGLGALTAAERRVAELAAQGLTNAEIAQELEIAAGTVKAHLRRVFAKVGVQTRTTLAARMHGWTGR